MFTVKEKERYEKTWKDPFTLENRKDVKFTKGTFEKTFESEEEAKAWVEENNRYYEEIGNGSEGACVGTQDYEQVLITTNRYFIEEC
ncbi:MAG: hypothetical protein K6A30_02690 [Lachnospiraceae bacterium]|nr:hypothetical protein [Lachnospiraceae bacterium]